MIIVDSLILSGLQFVFNRLAEAVDTEMNDDSRLREELLAAQLRLELGEITDDEFAEIEGSLLARLREITERRKAAAAGDEDGEDAAPGTYKVTGVTATFTGDTHDEG